MRYGAGIQKSSMSIVRRISGRRRLPGLCPVRVRGRRINAMEAEDNRLAESDCCDTGRMPLSHLRLERTIHKVTVQRPSARQMASTA